MIEFACKTDLGRVRGDNEDYVLAEQPADALTLAAKGALFIVADGMGGHQAGEVASERAAQIARREYYASAHTDPSERLRAAVQAANAGVYQMAQANIARRGMGTTIVAAAIIGCQAHIANVGDSRAYLVRPDGLTQITYDHSFVGDQVRAGILTREQAKGHPQRHVITRALGQGPMVQVDTYQSHLRPGDVLLLCSDGLTEHVPDSVIRDVALRNESDQATVKLAELANAGGGSDNISVIVVRAEPSTAQRKPIPPTAIVMLVIVVLVMIVTVAGLAMLTPTIGNPQSKIKNLNDLSTLTPGAVSLPFPTPISPTTTLRPTPQR